MYYQAKVEGMSCNGCANSVKAAFSQIDGVSDVKINLDEKKAAIESSNELMKEQLEAALADTSYTVETLN